MLARLSGVPTSTIRIWERRYQALTPDRSPAGGRLYSQADVTRLSLLRELVARGHSIRTVARLEDVTLRLQLKACAASKGAPLAECRIAAVGCALPQRIESALVGFPSIQCVAACADLDTLSLPAGGVDALLVEVPSLRMAQVEALLHTFRQLQPHLMIVVYPVAAARELGALAIDGILAIRGPVDIQPLLRICMLCAAANAEHAAANERVDSIMTARSEPDFTPAVSRSRSPEVAALLAQLEQASPLPRQYSDAQLQQLSLAGRQSPCQCPRQLSELLAAIGAFERYSEACANERPADSQLFQRLNAAAGHARSLMEQALSEVMLQRQHLNSLV